MSMCSIHVLPSRSRAARICPMVLSALSMVCAYCPTDPGTAPCATIVSVLASMTNGAIETVPASPAELIASNEAVPRAEYAASAPSTAA